MVLPISLWCLQISDRLAFPPQYFALPWRGGGGPFIVWPLSKPGRLPQDTPLFSDHGGAVMDLHFNPFVDECIASASDDTTVKVLPHARRLASTTRMLRPAVARPRRDFPRSTRTDLELPRRWPYVQHGAVHADAFGAPQKGSGARPRRARAEPARRPRAEPARRPRAPSRRTGCRWC